MIPLNVFIFCERRIKKRRKRKRKSLNVTPVQNRPILLELYTALTNTTKSQHAPETNAD